MGTGSCCIKRKTFWHSSGTGISVYDPGRGDLHSGATIYEATGAYNMKKRNEIITIVDKTEYQKLMAYINHEDPKAFVTVYNVSDMRYQPKL